MPTYPSRRAALAARGMTAQLLDLVKPVFESGNERGYVVLDESRIGRLIRIGADIKDKSGPARALGTDRRP
jgi:hypothetical protein